MATVDRIRLIVHFCATSYIPSASWTISAQSAQLLVHFGCGNEMANLAIKTHTCIFMFYIMRYIQFTFHGSSATQTNPQSACNWIQLYKYDFLHVLLSCAWKIYPSSTEYNSICFTVSRRQYCDELGGGWMRRDVPFAKGGWTIAAVFCIDGVIYCTWKCLLHLWVEVHESIPST